MDGAYSKERASMAEKTGEQGFERDWGYLMRFLDKLEAAAEAMPPVRRERLSSLLATKRQVCEDIRTVIDGNDQLKGTDVTMGAAPDDLIPRSRLTVGTLLE
jgi:hypothetical protein